MLAPCVYESIFSHGEQDSSDWGGGGGGGGGGNRSVQGWQYWLDCREGQYITCITQGAIQPHNAPPTDQSDCDMTSSPNSTCLFFVFLCGRGVSQYLAVNYMLLFCLAPCVSN